MKATANMVADNSTAAHFSQWAWGSGQWPVPTTYGISSFIYNAGFIQPGNFSTFGGSLEKSNQIGDGQLVWGNITFNVISTQASNGNTGAVYGFTGLSGGAIRVGQYIAAISGTTNDAGAFNIALSSSSPAGTVFVITSVTYTSTTTGTFTTAWTSGTIAFQAESGTGQINSTVTTFFLTGTQVIQPNNATVGATSNAAYGNVLTGQTTFKGYWQSGVSYVIGDVVIQAASGTGTTTVMGVWANILATSANAPPTTNVANANWVQYPYELWQTADNSLPAYVQSNQEVQSVTFNPLPFLSSNVAGNTLVAFGRFTGTPATITAASITSNVLTVTAINTFTAGQTVFLQGMAEAFLNGQTVTVLSTGLSGSQFEATFTHADFSNGADTGTALYTNPPTIRDTNNNTWVQLFSVINGADVNAIWVAYSAVGTTTTNFVTVSQPIQNTLQLAIAEYSGVTSVAPQLDQSTSNTGTSTSASSGNVTTTVANELLLGFIDNATANGLTVTPTGGFTARQTVNGNLVIMDQTVTATGTYAATATLSSSVKWFAAIATLKGTQLSPYYFKFEYGNISTNCPSVGFQVGTAITTTGALSASGLRGFREILGYASATASGATQWETDFYADSTPGFVGGKWAMIGWRTSTQQTGWFLGWERSKNNFGVDTNSYMTYVIGINPNTAWRMSSVFTSGGINFGPRYTDHAYSIGMGNASESLQNGNQIAVAPLFPSVGFFDNPMTIILNLSLADASEGAVFVNSIYGVNHNYLMTKGGGNTWAQYLANANAFGSIAMRWE